MHADGNRKTEINPWDHHLSLMQDHLQSCLRLGLLEGFFCTCTQSEVYTAALFNGEQHSKAPMQKNGPVDLEVTLLLPGERSASFSLASLSMSLFSRQLEFALSQSVPLEHRMKLSKHSVYPKIKLASDELISSFSTGSISKILTSALETTESYAAQIQHPRLMNREVSVTFSRSKKIYFDSIENRAEEISASCAISCSFSLEDSNEYYSDCFAHLPDENELKNVVELAAKNLLRSQVKPLAKDAPLAVYLTPKAVIHLLDELVLPNLETRTLIDKTGAWELSQIGEVVARGLTIEDNPHLEGSPFSTLFDFEGTPTQPVQMMSEGRLVHPLMTSSILQEVVQLHPEWSDRFRLTGHAMSANETSMTNVFFKFDRPALVDLSQESFVQIQNLTGMSVDPLTGQFALDADGAKVYEKGQLKYSTSLTLRGNFFHALEHKDTRVGPYERSYNQWAPGLLTYGLSCVSKELAQTFEDESR